MFQKADIPQLSTKGWLKHRCVDFLTNISHFLPISNQPYSSLSPSSQLPDIPNMFSVAPSHTSVQPTRIHCRNTHTHHPIGLQVSHIGTTNSLSTFICFANQGPFLLLPLILHRLDTAYNLLFHFFHNSHYSKLQ